MMNVALGFSLSLSSYRNEPQNIRQAGDLPSTELLFTLGSNGKKKKKEVRTDGRVSVCICVRSWLMPLNWPGTTSA